MLKRKMIYLMALVLSAGLTLTACGDDAPAGNNGDSTNNGGTDAGDTSVDDATDDAGTDTGGDSEGCTVDGDCNEGQVCEVSTGLCVAAPSGCELTGDERPERCDQTFEETTFGPGSVVTSFQVAGLLPDETPECCFDYDSEQDDGDADIDNALGELLVQFDQLDSINTSLSESIANGELILMFEHDGLTDLSAGETYGMNFFLGEYDENNNLLIDPASIESGTYPQARVENATIDGSSLSAGPGMVRLNIEVLSTPLSLVISQAKIEAEIDTANSSIADGIVMTGGKLGGVVRVDDVLDALNGYVETTCGCLGLEDKPLVTYDPNNISCFRDADDPEDGMYQGEECGCNSDSAGQDACTAAGEDTCTSIASNCGLIYSVLPTVADVDTDGDGTNDAISIGTTFETEGAVFTGIAAE